MEKLSTSILKIIVGGAMVWLAAKVYNGEIAILSIPKKSEKSEAL